MNTGEAKQNTNVNAIINAVKFENPSHTQGSALLGVNAVMYNLHWFRYCNVLLSAADDTALDENRDSIDGLSARGE